MAHLNGEGKVGYIDFEEVKKRFKRPLGDKEKVKKILSYLLHRKGLSILDAGCGSGWLSFILMRRGFKVVGLDISRERLLKEAKRHLKDTIPLVEGDLHQLPFKKESFDIVVCAEVLEHLKNPAIGLKEINRVLKKEGRLILTIPNNLTFPISIWEKILSLLKLLHTPHRQKFSKRKICQLIAEAGFSMKGFDNLLFFFPYFIKLINKFKKRKEPSSEAKEPWLFKYIPHHLAPNWIILCEKG